MALRRLFLFAPLLLLCAPAARAREEPTLQTRLERMRVDAVAQGLSYLASQQMRDGSFGRTEAGTVGITSLSLLAFMAAGHQEGRGRYGEVLRKGLRFLLDHSLPPSARDPDVSTFGDKPTGYIYVVGDTDSRMHGHGYATQVLVLAYGSGRTNDAQAAEMRRKIQRAVRVIEESQTVTGGWGYEPNSSSFHEGSVTVTVVQALRLAADAGFVVDRGVHERGLNYLHGSQKPDGSFKYSLMEERSSAALTAAALTAMHGFGEYYTATIRRGLEYLEDQYRHPLGISWPFYANYYAAQAFYRAGGRYWKLWTRDVVPSILESQSSTGPDGGYWDDRDVAYSVRAHGRAYATAFSCLALSVPDGYLPLFQR